MSLPEWADSRRRLSPSAGAVGGRWRTSRFEVARGPMMAVKEPGVMNISAMVATQTLKTELILNVIGYHADLDPCPIQLVLPKDEAVKKFSKERLTPMVRETPALTHLFGDLRTRRSEDTLGYKEFPGGFLALESAGSPMNLASRAIRITLLDEIDKFETTKEGDPVTLAEERTATFTDRALRIRCCSPTWVETSRIFASWKQGDQRRPYVKCPHAECQHEQTLDFFKSVQWSKSEDGTEHFPMTAAIVCEACGAEWSEAQRLAIVSTEGAIRWYQTRPFVCCGEEQEPMKTRAWEWNEKFQIGYACCVHCGKRGVSNKHASFQASKLYSPVSTVVELAEKWIAAKDDPETKQTFYNTQLGLPFEAQALRKVEAGGLALRAEQYGAQVPMGVLVLTAGVDVQPGSTASEGRLEVEVVGWGLGEESWSISHEVLRGDPAQPDIWTELDEFLLTAFEHESGNRMAIRAACVDSGGHNTQEVYNFCRPRIARNIWAIKGASDRSGQWSPVWPIPKLDSRKTKNTGYRPIIVGVNSAKEAIRQRLLIEEPGPGFAHFPTGRTQGYYDQLTSEQLLLEKKAGFTNRVWHLPRGHANEALDIRVYAYAALCGLYATRKLNLARLKAQMETMFALPQDVAASEPQPEAPPAPVVPIRNRVRRSRWAEGH